MDEDQKPYTGPTAAPQDWAHEFYGAQPSGGDTAQAQQQPDPGQQQVQSFWHRLVHGASDGRSRTVDIAQHVARGAAAAVDNTIDAVGEVAALPAKAVGADPKMPHTHLADAVLTKKSDDPIANFAESVTQFALPFAATGALGIEEGAAALLPKLPKAAGFISALTRGAIADYAGFDPYQGGLAELVSKAPVPVVKQLGELLTPKADDPGYVARLKRATEGAIAGTTFDALLAVGKIARGRKVLEDGAAAATEKEAAQATITDAQKTLQKIQDGAHRTDEAVQVVPAEDGRGFKLEGNGESKDSPTFADRSEADAQAATLNMADNARKRALIPEADRVQILDNFKEITQSGQTQDQLIEKLTQRNNFNISYLAEPKEVMGLVESISQHLGDAIDAAQKHPDGVPVEKSFELASKTLGGLAFNEAPQAIVDKLGQVKGLHVWTTAGNMVMRDMGASVVKLAHLADARPHDVVLLGELKAGIANYYDVLHSIAGANSEVGRTLRMMQERANPLMENFSYREGAQVAEGVAQDATTALTQAGKARESLGTSIVAGMEPRDIRDTARMLKLAGDSPQNLVYVSEAVRREKLDGFWPKAMEWFSNALLSSPTTPATVLVSGITTNTFEAAGRILAGARTRNTALAREGADLLYGYFHESMDAIRSAKLTFQSGQSVINPQPARYAISGPIGSIVRVPGRTLLATDELVRATAYRSYVRAKSLRMGRETGLAGEALDQYVQDNLRNAFTRDIRDSSGELMIPAGMATVGDALKFGEQSTFSGALGSGTLGGDLQALTNRHTALKWIAPFVKASVNIFRYAHSMTPVLNRWNAQARATMEAGGEEAATLSAKTAMAGSLYVAGMGMYSAGSLTGRGPSDPQLRKVWLRDHQPYSLKVGDEWISYRKADPLGVPLGLMADMGTLMMELGDQKDQDPSNLATAFVSALTQNLTSKSYLSGVTDFFDAWGSGDPYSTKRWIQNMAGSFVPNALNTANTDPYYREVNGVMEALMARTPGLSDKLLPSYDGFGHPVMKADGTLNRFLNPLRFEHVTHNSVNDALLELRMGMPTEPKKLVDGTIDLTDPKWANKDGKVPYQRLNELIASGVNGHPSREDQLRKLVTSAEWKDMSGGSAQFPNASERAVRVQNVVAETRARALQQVMEEYPDVKTAFRNASRLKGASITGGQQAVDALQQTQQLFNPSR